MLRNKPRPLRLAAPTVKEIERAKTDRHARMRVNSQNLRVKQREEEIARWDAENPDAGVYNLGDAFVQPPFFAHDALARDARDALAHDAHDDHDAHDAHDAHDDHDAHDAHDDNCDDDNDDNCDDDRDFAYYDEPVNRYVRLLLVIADVLPCAGTCTFVLTIWV
jgi:hypothetical protein